MMHPRTTTLTSLSLMLPATATNAWDFIIISGDSELETTPTAHFPSGNKRTLYTAPAYRTRPEAQPLPALRQPTSRPGPAAFVYNKRIMEHS